MTLLLFVSVAGCGEGPPVLNAVGKYSDVALITDLQNFNSVAFQLEKVLEVDARTGLRPEPMFNVDVFDMPLIPGCVSAEPNGMAYAELRDILRAVAAHMQVVGFDFVEVNPQLDVGTGITSYLGAHTMLEFLGAICDQPGWAERVGR